VVTWYRAVISDAMDHPVTEGKRSIAGMGPGDSLARGNPRGVPVPAAIDKVIARFELAPALQPVLVLLYGAHLCGQRGVAPVDVARLHDHRWDDALGRGELAARGVAEYAGSRVALSTTVLRVLDELPPATGVLVGEPGAVVLLGPCVVVDDAALAELAERHRARVGGAIIVARDGVDRAALLLEARACGAVAMLRISASLDAVPTEPAIYVVSDAELADRLGVPRLE
jgi:hypothetical protein